MTQHELEGKIKKAFTGAVPDVLDSVLCQCKEQKGTVISMTEKKRTNPWTKRIAWIAAALVLLAGVAIGFQSYRSNYTVASVVSLDVNPSIEIQVNTKERVLDVLPLNSDGEVVVAGMDFKGSDIDVAVNAIIGSMLRNGYLNDLSNSILISVDSNNQDQGVQLQTRLTEEVNTLLQTDTFSGAVLSQTVSHDSDLERLANSYGISVGKAQLIQQITTQNTFYSFEELAPLSINELNLISESGSVKLDNVESVGTASDKSYIGEAKAKAAALAHTGANEKDIRRYSFEMDYERGVMVYEIEFHWEQYEYDYYIDAITGEVISHNKEIDDDFIPPQSSGDPNTNTNANNANNTTGQGSNTQNPSSNADVIGEEAAKNAAFAHAGVSADSAVLTQCKLDQENGVLVYEVDFKCDGYEYEYDINAATGAVAKHSKEWDDDYRVPQQPSDNVNSNSGGANADANTSGASAPTMPSSSAAANVIGEETAKNAAFAHAGVSSGNVSRCQCSLDREDGLMVYEIDFMCGGYEYEYEINAATGAVVKYDKEWDD